MRNIKTRKIIPVIVSLAFLGMAGFFAVLGIKSPTIATPDSSPIKSADDTSLLGTGDLPKVVKLSDGEQSKTNDTSCPGARWRVALADGPSHGSGVPCSSRPGWQPPPYILRRLAARTPDADISGVLDDLLLV
jgi:hypothetical protein